MRLDAARPPTDPHSTDPHSDKFELGLVARLPDPVRAWAELMRLDRPIGTWLLLLPCWWGLALAGSLDPWLYALFGIGAVVMRGAGCTINDLMDRDIDAQVARTATRPLPSGRISLGGAFALLAAQLAIGLAVLLSLNRLSWVLGFAIMAVVVIYPLMKRVTWWPQVVLGIAFNWGVIVGHAAADGTVWPAAAALYLAGLFWTLGYDTIYAHQDKADDARVGVKSTARRLGDASRSWIAGFYATTVGLAAAAGVLAASGWPFWLGLTLFAGHCAIQIWRVDLDHPPSCLRWFRANAPAGWLILLGLLGDRLIP